MSLKDTIKGARAEADANGNPFARNAQNGANEQTSAGSASSESRAGAGSAPASQGFTRRSAAKAKPSRKAAAGVRVVSGNKAAKKPEKEMTKEERKSSRKHDREVADLRYNVVQKMLEANEDYRHNHKVWIRLLIVGGAFMLLSLALYTVVNQQGASVSPIVAFGSLGSMIASYVAIIIAFVYDWRHIRNMRLDMESQVRSMSEKRLMNTIKKLSAAEKS